MLRKIKRFEKDIKGTKGKIEKRIDKTIGFMVAFIRG